MELAGARNRGLGGSAATLPVLAVLAVAVFASAWGGIALTYYTGRIAAIWLANAIVLAAALKTRRSGFPAVLLTAFAANVAADVVSGDGVLSAGVLSLANAAEVIIVVLALRRLRLDREFGRPKTLLVFYALALGPAPLVSAFIAGGYLHLADVGDFWPVVKSWYIGDALGLIILVPPLVTVRVRDFAHMFAPEDRAITLLLIAAVAAVIFLNVLAPEYPFAFLYFPAILLLTFVRGFAGGALGLLLAGTFLLSVVLSGHATGGLSGHTLREQIMIVQVFVAMLSFTVTLVGAALDERRWLERRMAEAVERAEEAREEAVVAKDAAETASRTKSMFLANMSHELRTPLNAVIGFSEVMQGEMYGPMGNERYRGYARMIHEAGAHLLELINDVLDMSKIEAGKFEIERRRIDMRSVLRDCVTLMHDRADEASVALIVNTPNSPLWINADRRALKQILLNLISNGVKFTPAGGEVRISATLETGRCVLSVRDTGVGIPAEAIERLGNPFVQLRADAAHSHQGTGLGLALVRALTEMHEGTMHIESREGAGTTVTIELPQALSKAEAA